MTRMLPECETVRARLARGELTASDEDHLLGCEACASIAVPGLETQILPEPDELNAMLTAVEARIDQERGAGAFLRSRPTWQRWLLVAFTALTLMLAAATFGGPSEKPAALPTEKLVLMGVYALALTLVLRELLRPSHVRRRDTLQNVLAWVMLGVPTGIAALHASLSGTATASRIGCVRVGLAIGFTLLMLLRAIDRAPQRSRTSAWLAISAAGLLANLSLLLYCPGTGLVHLLAWHAPVGLWLAAGYALRTRKRHAQ